MITIGTTPYILAWRDICQCPLEKLPLWIGTDIVENSFDLQEALMWRFQYPDKKIIFSDKVKEDIKEAEEANKKLKVYQGVFGVSLDGISL